MALEQGATCPQHPGVLAVDVCERCGRFVCAECLVLRTERVLCAACAAIPYGISARTHWVLGLGIGCWLACTAVPLGRARDEVMLSLLGLVGGAPVAIVALILGQLERRAIDRGTHARDGLRRLRWGVRLAGLHLAAQLLLVASFIAWRVWRSA